ncbi:hypothetical protein GGR53DRAFT_463755 [Hypoxylon sp. FL1150]|nr:hypothetical protein GGR53DRAFT_463755 [Hypoxylon sp. FL1150]
MFPPTSNEPCFAVRLSPGKGFGVFATRDIKAGEVVLVEKTLLSHPARCSDVEGTLAIINNFSKLSKEDQDKFLQLSTWYDSEQVEGYENILRFYESGQERPAEELKYLVRIVATFNTNAFTLKDGKGALFLQASRFNHCCDPNVFCCSDMVPDHWFAAAARDISSGAELFISYVIPEPPRIKRKRDIMSSWGFRCECERCVQEFGREYDKELEEAARIEEKATKRQIELFPEEDKVPADQWDEGFQETLERRCTLLEYLSRLPELFFS